MMWEETIKNNLRIMVVSKKKKEQVTVSALMKDVEHDGKIEEGKFKDEKFVITKFSYVITHHKGNGTIYLFVNDNFDRGILETLEYPYIDDIKKAYNNFLLNKGKCPKQQKK